MQLIDVTDALLVPSSLCNVCHGTGIKENGRACMECLAGKNVRQREKDLLQEVRAARRAREYHK